MCDCDLERPAVWNEGRRKARIQHTCCECSLAIAPGSEYVWMKGLWDGEWATFKMCLNCERVAKIAGIDDCYTMGSLFEELSFDFGWDKESKTYISNNPQLEIVSHHPLRLAVKKPEAA